MTYKAACLMSWGLVLLVAFGILMVVQAMNVDVAGYIYSMMGV